MKFAELLRVFSGGRVLKRVLLIGDSIKFFYKQEVADLLGEEYEVCAPNENCRFSGYGLNSLRFWLTEFPDVDIIHFNFGLWDTAILYKEDGCFTPIEEYISAMKKILRELKKTGAKIIFATTTPVHDEKYKLEGPIPPAHKNEDIIRYNRAVLKAFENEEILVNDLHSLIYSEKEKYLLPDMIHPNPDGVKILGKAVADSIRLMKVTNKKEKILKIGEFTIDEKTVQ